MPRLPELPSLPGGDLPEWITRAFSRRSFYGEALERGEKLFLEDLLTHKYGVPSHRDFIAFTKYRGGRLRGKHSELKINEMLYDMYLAGEVGVEGNNVWWKRGGLKLGDERWEL